MGESSSFDIVDILLVDDRPENLLTLAAVLACPEYRLIKKKSGDEALRYLLDHNPALILMDVQMPDLNGFETAAIIKGNERTRDIPIIFITAIDQDEQFVHKGYDRGAVDYIYKPYDSHVLKAKTAVFAGIQRQSLRVSRLVAVQRAATQSLAESANVADAIVKVLQSICTSLGWDLGIFWKLDKQANALSCHTEWHDSTGNAPDFLAESFKTQYQRGAGLPGRVWANRSALWIAEVTKDEQFPRFAAAERENLATAVLLPVCVQDETLGVIEFYSRRKLAEDADLVKIMGAIGSQIGQVLKRTEAFELVRANEARSSFLVQASTALSSSLNYDATLSCLADLVVKSLADWCVIDVSGEEEQPRSLAIAHPDAAKQALAVKLRETYPGHWNPLIGVPNSVRICESELHPDVTVESLEQAAKTQPHLMLMRDLGMRSAMVVPLVARAKILGAITFIAAKSGRHYTKNDLLFAEELARRAAMAIDNAKLYRDAQEAIRTRDEFFSIASHELKTPITSLKMMLQVTQRGVKPEKGIAPPPEKLAKMLDTSSRQVNRLTHLIEDLLDVVKIRAGKLNFDFEELNLSELAKEVVEQYSDALAAAKCPLELNIEPEVIGYWDRSRIEQVVVNLISNAIKYAPGARIKIEVRSRAETAQLVIQDFGPGIAPAQQAKMFQRFERANASRNITGLGLGLFIVKQIVEAHGGTIRIESQEGKGSAFIVELPRREGMLLKVAL